MRTEVLEELGLTNFSKGDIAIFCGAGISFSSGLPLAGQLERKILSQLTDDENEISRILNSKLPFEAFMEIVLSNYFTRSGDEILQSELSDLKEVTDKDGFITLDNFDEHFDKYIMYHGSLFNVFKADKPSTTHMLIAKLIKHGFIKTVITTNFDLLIEKALAEKDINLIPEKDFNVFYSEKQLTGFLDSPPDIRIFKIHGSLNDYSSIRTMIKHVADKHLSESWANVLSFVFKDGPHKIVIVLGYSCSDAFDIAPVIEAIFSSNKRVILVRHTEDSLNIKELKDAPKEEKLSNGQEHKNNFTAYSGKLVTGNTDELVKGIWESIEPTIGTYVSVKVKPSWENIVIDWGKEAKSDTVMRHFILSLLMRAIGDFDGVIKHSFESLNAPKGLIQHQDDLLTVLYGNLAGAFSEKGNLSEADKWNNEALKAAQLEKSKKELSSILGNMAIEALAGNRCDEAITLYKKALTIAVEINDKAAQVQCYCRLANAYNAKEDYPKARESALKALNYNDPTLEGTRTRAYTYMEMCRAHAGLGLFSIAKQYANEARTLFEKLHNDSEICKVYAVLSELYQKAQDTENTILHYRKSISLAEKLKMEMLEASQINLFAYFLVEKRSKQTKHGFKISSTDRDEIEPLFRRGVEILESGRVLPPESAATADVHCCWGVFLSRCGDKKQALTHFLKSEQIYLKIKNKTESDKKNLKLTNFYLKELKAHSFLSRI